MIKEAATSTDVRKAKVMNLLNQLKVNKTKIVGEFGLQISDQFAEIDARILNAPDLEYGQGRTVPPRNGVWNAERTPFLQPVKPSAGIVWGVLVLDNRIYDNFVNDMCQMVSYYYTQI